MRRIAQRNFESGDCGIACAAMLAKTTYAAAHEAAEKLSLVANDGTYYTFHQDLIELLQALKVRRVLRKRFTTWRSITVPAIVKTHPRQSGRYWHWVVVVDDRVGVRVMLDPKPGKSRRIVSFKGYKGVGQYLCVA